LITGVGWFPAEGEGDRKESRAAYCYVQNRTQTWLDFLSVPTGGAKPTRLMRESTEAWVEPQGDPKFLKDGSFLLASERTGFRHLYLFDRKGTLKNQVTRGDWEATSIQHVDEKQGFVYFMGNAESSITSDLYRIKLDGTDMICLTFPFVEYHTEAATTDAASDDENESASSPRGAPGGMHSITFAPSGNYFIDSWSDHQTPTSVALFRSNGSRLRTLDSNPVYSHEEYQRGDFELVQIPARDGFLLEASVLLPPGYDPAVRYPVWLQTYAGPHAPSVFDSWQGGRLGDEALAREGVIVFRTDPRSASGKGAKSAWTAYKQLGVQELMDLEDAVKWLCKLPYVDPTRIGISGGSYGGFMTAYALTHSTVFSAGVAISSPTDWRDYDSIYTERYMGMPQENPEGYDKTSVVKAAKNLHGRLLLVHGTMDDNVHMLNSLKLVRALQAANKQFEFMLYPGSRHGVGGGHYRAMFYDFIRRTFQLENHAEGATDGKP
ncbi:MAG: prolyl oligopeptidase family serine peptidase, partial [Pyrinomonadaceae bacterium]|nr:prolyl oligopeptidase family serine peptidase [Phycisphaerales bacterium]